MRYMIVCRQDENTLSVGRQVRNKLDEAGWQHTESDPQLVICIGGDGTFLRLVHACDFPTSPIIGINTGHLGFFQEILPEDISGFLDSYEKQEYTLQNIWPIDAIIDTVDGTYQLRGVNEIVIRGPHTHLTHLGIEIDGSGAEFRKRLLFGKHVFTGGAGASTVRLLPALGLSEAQADEFVARLKALLEDFH